VICPLAEFYVNGAAHEAGAVAAAEVTASHKQEKYADLDSHCLFKLIALETVVVLNSSSYKRLTR